MNNRCSIKNYVSDGANERVDCEADMDENDEDYGEREGGRERRRRPSTGN
jgi:hypothetical protein